MQVSRQVLQADPDLVANFLCAMRVAIDPFHFRRLAHALRQANPVRTALVSSTLASTSSTGRSLFDAEEVLADLAPSDGRAAHSNALQDVDIVDIHVGEIVEQFATLGPNDVDVAADILRAALETESPEWQQILISRLAALGPFCRSVVMRAVPRGAVNRSQLDRVPPDALAAWHS